jgi:hypothetical protein
MMLRIEVRPENTRTTVSVAGRLEGQGVHELLEACNAVSGELVLDLTELRSADPRGIEAIQGLVRVDAKIEGASSFIRLLLDD